MKFTDLQNDSWGAIKLPLSVDEQRLAAEVKAIAPENWTLGGRTSRAFANTQAIFLKGYAAAEKNDSLDDREILADLPYIRSLMYELIPAEPQKCVLSLLPHQERVGLHVDSGEYFKRTLRIHFPVVTNKKVSMFFGALYKMLPGEVWLLNNCAGHGVENDHQRKARIHLICDYIPSDALLELIQAGDAKKGVQDPKLVARLRAKTR